MRQSSSPRRGAAASGVQVAPGEVAWAGGGVGARLLSASQLSVKMADISELAMSTLAAQGVPLHRARTIVLTVERFTVGHVLEEQAARPTPDDLKDFDMTTFTNQHPTLITAITDYFSPGRTVDDLFTECLEVVIAGASATTS